MQNPLSSTSWRPGCLGHDDCVSRQGSPPHPGTMGTHKLEVPTCVSLRTFWVKKHRPVGETRALLSLSGAPEPLLLGPSDPGLQTRTWVSGFTYKEAPGGIIVG